MMKCFAAHRVLFKISSILEKQAIRSSHDFIWEGVFKRCLIALELFFNWPAK